MSCSRIAPAALAVLLLAGPAAAQATYTTTIQTSDGVRLAATVYVPSRRPAPAVILVHMLTRHRGDWHDFATRLAEAGIGALAIDLRGHGASGSTPNGVTGTSQDLARSVRDVEAARRFLRSRPDLFTERVGMAGASIGANLALLAAQNDASVASLVMLSPGLDYRGLRSEAALGKYGSRPVLLVASEEDPYALRSARRLAESGPGIRELRTVFEAAHGTVMLQRDPDLIGQLVDWFRRTLVS